MTFNIKIKFFFLTIITCSGITAYGKYKIVTSITPLASIVASLVGDEAEIDTIYSGNDCPHHYQAKPSDLSKVRDADIVIYINEAFDQFVVKLINSKANNIIKISDIKLLHIIKNHNKINWHLWLDLNNIILLQEDLAKKLTAYFPEISDKISLNLKSANLKILELSKIKKERLTNLSKVILINDSLEYFFINQPHISKIYSSNNKSLKYLNSLKKMINEANIRCLILNTEEDPKFYKRFNVPIIQLESENWQLEGDLKDLFYKKYLKMINELYVCSQ